MANLLIQSRQPQLLGIALRACVLLGFARSPAWFGFAALAGGLFYAIEKTAVAQRLGLVEGQPDIRDGFVAQNLLKEFAVGGLAAGVICAGFLIRAWPQWHYLKPIIQQKQRLITTNKLG